MHKIKEMLMNELYEYEEKAKRMSGGKLSTQELEKIHRLTDTVKNIDKIELMESEDGYSEESAWMADGRMYGTSYDGGSSYARGRGRNAKRDSMGRYSRDGGSSYNDGMMHGDSSYARDGRGGYSRDGASEHLINKAEEMLGMASNEEERRAIHQLIKKLEDD
jgi:hypothetical protein